MDKILIVAEYFKNDNVLNIHNVKKVLLDNDFIIKTKESKDTVKVLIYEDKYSSKNKQPFTGASCKSEIECWSVIFDRLLVYFKEKY